MPVIEPVVAYIGLGSNLEKPEDQLRSARKAIAALTGVHDLAISSLYRSAPMGPADQPDYVNAVMAVSTTLEPLELLDALQAIELAQGRVRRGERWGPRTLDLDVLLFGEWTLNLPRLTVPHPGLPQREFVLYPMAEIAPPELAVPGYGVLGELVKHCPDRGIQVIGHV